MADFTALKTAITNAIKQNGNQAITGNLLQEILIAMVENMGDTALNGLATSIQTSLNSLSAEDGNLANAISSEESTRQTADNSLSSAINSEALTRSQADATLQQNINTESNQRQSTDNSLQNQISVEKNARIDAVNRLQGLIDAINNVVGNGYTFGGVVKINDAPQQGKMFYIALERGNYINFGGVSVHNGITLIYNNGQWIAKELLDLDVFYGEILRIVNAYQPIVIEGNVTNAPDEEDLTSNNIGLLQFKNKAYAPTIYSGLGRKYLRKNIRPLTDSASFDGFVENVESEASLSGTPEAIFWDRINERFVGKKDDVYYQDWTDSDDYVPVSSELVYMNEGTPYRWDGTDLIVYDEIYPDLINMLTQEMISDANTIYHIQYNFTLGEDITVPANCVLEFDGGSISDDGTHIFTGTNTLLSGNIKCLATIAGTFANDYLDVTWFGAVGDDNTDCRPVFVNVCSICIANSIDMYIPEGIFAFKSGNLHISGQYNAGTDTSKYLDCNNITIKGVFRKSVIKQYSRGDVVNLSWIKNLHIKDISITSGVVGIQDWGVGNNMISVIDAINVFIEWCYIHDAYWVYQKNTTNNQYYFDGGKGITIQGELYENIRVVNCDIENCVWGLDINPHGSHFYNSEKSFIYASNINITKCNTGVLVHAYNYTVGENTVLNGLMSIQARVTDCLKALSSNYTAGANIIIEATSNQSVAELLNSGYGTPWTQSVSYAESEDNDMLCLAATLAAPRNSNISVNAHYKEANYGFYISPRTEGRSGNLYKFSGNVLNLNLSPEVEIVPVVTEQEITTESKIYFYTNPNYNQGPANGNIINVNGCDLNYTTIHTVFFPLNNTNDNIIISDGIAYQRTSFVQEIKGIRDNALGGEAGSLKVINGILSFKKFVSSASSAYPVVAFVDNNNIAHTFMCGDGSIGKDYVRDDAIKNALMGGKGIRVRLSSNWTGNPEGYIPVYGKNKGTTDERNALTLSADDSGLPFFDKTLNKPLWWNGIAWVDATGATV